MSKQNKGVGWERQYLQSPAPSRHTGGLHRPPGLRQVRSGRSACFGLCRVGGSDAGRVLVETLGTVYTSHARLPGCSEPQSLVLRW